MTPQLLTHAVQFVATGGAPGIFGRVTRQKEGRKLSFVDAKSTTPKLLTGQTSSHWIPGLNASFLRIIFAVLPILITQICAPFFYFSSSIIYLPRLISLLTIDFRSPELLRP